MIVQGSNQAPYRERFRQGHGQHHTGWKLYGCAIQVQAHAFEGGFQGGQGWCRPGQDLDTLPPGRKLSLYIIDMCFDCSTAVLAIQSDQI